MMSSCPRRHRLPSVARGVALAAIVGLLVTPRAASADVVLQWNEIAVNAAIATGQSPFAQARFAAIVQVAVFTAVNAIGGEYEPYLDTVTAAPGASKDAAVIAAAYRVLTTYFGSNPTVLATLNAARTASLAAIPDGPAENAGIAAGEAAAAAILALRANDGATPAQFYTVPPAAPGEWQATPGCPVVGGVQVGSFLQWRNVAPFGVDSVSAFLPPPPPALTSNEYAKAYNEVKAIGAANSTERAQDRSDVVNFYALSSPTYIFNMVARQIAAAKGDSLEENARSLALINMAISDALVASFNAKYLYRFWRPETAIRAGGTDGNGKTTADLGWAPYIVTPCFPSYPSNHASGSNAGAEMLRRLYGAAGFEIELTSPNPALAGITLQYSQLREIISDISDARVYGGIHFRFDQDAGERVGREIATYVFKNNLRPVHGVQ
jgi:PAP2 superfamily